MYQNTTYGSARPLPTQNDVNAGNVSDLQRRRTRSTNPFDYDPYDRSNLSDSPPPPPVPPRPHALSSSSASSVSSPPPRPPPPPHHYPSAPNASGYRSPPLPELRPFPREESDSDLSVPSSTTSSNRPSPSYVAQKPVPPTYTPDSEYFNNPWGAEVYTPDALQQHTSNGFRGGGLSIPQDSIGVRQRAKSSVDLRASASHRGGLRQQQQQPGVSTFVPPTMSFPMPEIPPTFGAAMSGGVPSSSGDAYGTAGLSQSQGYHAPLGRTTSAQATFGNTAGKISQHPSPPRSQTRNSFPSVSEVSPTTPTAPSEDDDGSKTRRPNSASSSGRTSSSRGEFRFSPNLMKLQHMPSVTSIRSTSTTTSSVYRNVDEYEDGFSSPTDQASFSTDSMHFNNDSEEFAVVVDKQLSSLSLDMDENVLRFQKGELPDQDQEWHRLVPSEALNALDETEIKRQGIIFELLKAEREYVADLETMEEVFIKGITSSQQPIIPEANMQAFVENVFGNLHEILAHHRRMLERLFERQRETHPLIQSVADIVLDTIVKPEFRDAYEKYIKQYPVAESYHQKELKSNKQYRDFLQSVSREPRVKKRDMKIFLNRPLTRLVRLKLLLEEMHKRTDKEHQHPDTETLPIISGIVNDCIKATQPGIETAEQKVKFWDLCENIVPQRAEIIDMDLYNPERHLVYMGSVWRKVRSDKGFSSDKWQEVTAALLDNYFIICREGRWANGAMKKVIASRPIPLSFVRLAAFNAPPETRREKVETGSLLDTFRSQDVALYPFTLYHASPTLMKAYTLYAPTESLRKKWHASFVDALTVHKVQQENNQMFAEETLVDGYFRIPKEPIASPAMQKVTGRVSSAVPFATQNGQRYLAVGCASGIYVAPYNRPKEMVRVFTFSSPHYLAALQSINDKHFNRFVIHADTRIISYSLELVAKFVGGRLDPKVLEASKENVTSGEQNVLFVRHCMLQERVLLIYASKKRLSSSVTIHAVEAVAHSVQRPGSAAPSSFRPFGQPGYIPKEAYDIVALAKTVNICTKSGLVSAHPGDFPNTATAPIPVFQSDSGGSNPAMTFLKGLVEHARPLGIVKSNNSDEYLVIFDDLGVYVNSRGLPVRKYMYLKWETKATSYAHRSELILLFSPRFIEVREVSTGKLVQVIEGGDIRLLYSDPEVTPHDNILVVVRGKFNDGGGLSERVVELVRTVEIQREVVTPGSAGSGTPGSVSGVSVWSEWDM